MATTKGFIQSVEARMHRRFSETFKTEKVREVEVGLVRVIDLCKTYEISSMTVYRWLDKYGSKREKKQERMIVETLSDTKQLMDLKKRVAELERLVGQKQIQIEFQEKMIDLAEDFYQVDIKKKFSGGPLSGTGDNGKPWQIA